MRKCAKKHAHEKLILFTGKPGPTMLCSWRPTYSEDDGDLKKSFEAWYWRWKVSGGKPDKCSNSVGLTQPRCSRQSISSSPTEQAKHIQNQVREGVQMKKTFLIGHCPFRGGGGRPLPGWFGEGGADLSGKCPVKNVCSMDAFPYSTNNKQMQIKVQCNYK